MTQLRNMNKQMSIVLGTQVWNNRFVFQSTTSTRVFHKICVFYSALGCFST